MNKEKEKAFEQGAVTKPANVLVWYFPADRDYPVS
jgi:hypothetical protein